MRFHIKRASDRTAHDLKNRPVAPSVKIWAKVGRDWQDKEDVFGWVVDLTWAEQFEKLRKEIGKPLIHSEPDTRDLYPELMVWDDYL